MLFAPEVLVVDAEEVADVTGGTAVVVPVLALLVVVTGEVWFDDVVTDPCVGVKFIQVSKSKTLPWLMKFCG